MTKQKIKKALLKMGYRAINDEGELKVLEEIKRSVQMVDCTLEDITSIEKTKDGFKYFFSYGNESIEINSTYSINDDIERINDWVNWGSLNYR